MSLVINDMLRSTAVIVALMSTCSAQAGALGTITASLPEVPAPPSGEAQWIARSMRLNGLPMTLKGFNSRMSADAVLLHYESWSKHQGRAASIRSSNSNWQILALRFEQHFVTIQARSSDGGSHGTIAVSPDLARASLRLDSQFPKPASASIVNLQQYEDADQEAEHISLLSKRAAHIEARAYAQLLRDEGWSVIREQAMVDVARGRVIEAQYGAQRALLTVLPNRAHRSSTAIVVVWRKS